MNYMSGIENRGLWTTILKWLGLRKADPIFRKTRLMYFDLIVLFTKKQKPTPCLKDSRDGGVRGMIIDGL